MSCYAYFRVGRKGPIIGKTDSLTAAAEKQQGLLIQIVFFISDLMFS